MEEIIEVYIKLLILLHLFRELVSAGVLCFDFMDPDKQAIYFAALQRKNKYPRISYFFNIKHLLPRHYMEKKGYAVPQPNV
jgi:hypothetical protein